MRIQAEKGRRATLTPSPERRGPPGSGHGPSLPPPLLGVGTENWTRAATGFPRWGTGGGPLYTGPHPGGKVQGPSDQACQHTGPRMLARVCKCSAGPRPQLCPSPQQNVWPLCFPAPHEPARAPLWARPSGPLAWSVALSGMGVPGPRARRTGTACDKTTRECQLWGWGGAKDSI